MNIIKFLSSLAMFYLLAHANGQNKIGFETMVNTLLSGKVDTLSSTSLSAKTNTDDFVLLDTRERAEFEVSHLPGAIHVGYKSFDESSVSGFPRDSKIVVYCSIGRRSDEIGERLKKIGFTDVQNLWGGIFDWTNRGYTVVDVSGAEVCRVHPYSFMWGLWINKCEKSYEPR